MKTLLRISTIILSLSLAVSVSVFADIKPAKKAIAVQPTLQKGQMPKLSHYYCILLKGPIWVHCSNCWCRFFQPASPPDSMVIKEKSVAPDTSVKPPSKVPFEPMKAGEDLGDGEINTGDTGASLHKTLLINDLRWTMIIREGGILVIIWRPEEFLRGDDGISF